MKRIVFGMGSLQPAHLVKAHFTYNPTIPTTDLLDRLFKYCKKTNNETLADELVGVVVDDIRSDLDIQESDDRPSDESVFEYYRKYADVIYRYSNIVSGRMLSELRELIPIK